MTYSKKYSEELDQWIVKNISEGCSHGKVAFQGLARSSVAHFVRLPLVDATENVDKVVRLITDKWHILKSKSKPNMIVSVIGSLDGFNISNDVSANVKEMIRKVSQIPGTWFVTEGTHAGVAKLVGNAVCEEEDIVCIGIPRWGAITHQDQLSKLSASGICQYHAGTSWLQDKRHHHLNPHHTHFLMVDHGQTGDFSKGITFRTEFERYMSTVENTPYVMVVINGHVDTFRVVCEMAREHCGTIMLVKGTGGVADLLIDMLTCWKSHAEWKQRINDKRFKQGLQELEDVEGKWKKLFECRESGKFIVAPNENEKGINERITDTLLCGKLDKSKWRRTFTVSGKCLQLSLLWSRPEILREILPLDNTEIMYSAQKAGIGLNELAFLLENLLIMALCRANVAFVEMLLVDYEVDIKAALNIEVLELLYGYQTHEKNFPRVKAEYYKYIESNYNDTIPPEREELIREIYGYSDNWDVIKDKCTLRVDGINHLRRMFAGNVDVDNVNERNLEERPFFELFIWSVVCNLPDMAQFLLPLEGNQMAKALLASKFWEASVIDKQAYDEDTFKLFQEDSKMFRMYAQDMLEQCYSKNKEKTEKLITTKLDFCGGPGKTSIGATCLEVAVHQENKDFVSHSCPQKVLLDVWTGPISPEKNDHTQRLKKVIAFYLPFLINMIYKFEGQTRHSSCLQLAYWKNIWVFYTKTPMVTSTIMFLGNVLFLLSYFFTILHMHRNIDVPPSIHISNFSFWIGYGSTAISHVTKGRGSTGIKKVVGWLSDMKNVFDLILLTVFLIATAVYHIDNKLGKTIHSISWALWCVSAFFRQFRGEGVIAVYINMIIIMIWNLKGKIGAILLMFLPFVCAYGVVSAALIYPPGKEDFFTIIVRPIINVFGVHPHVTVLRGNSTFLGTPEKEVEAYQQYVVVVFYIVYLLVANILLLNIMIALFNTSYIDIANQGNKTVKFGRYQLVVEYAQRIPILIQFVIIPHLFILLSYLVRKLCWLEPRLEWSHKKLKRERGNLIERIDLTQFESDCAMLVYKKRVPYSKNQRNADGQRTKHAGLDGESIDLNKLKNMIEKEFESMKSKLESIPIIEAEFENMKSKLESIMTLKDVVKTEFEIIKAKLE